jgi:ATP-dependent exoDNAse (exonuclease V) alpha subunit
VAIYHLSVKPISRSKGRSATAAAAYRAGCRIVDERTGEIHNYERKQGVEHAEIVLPRGAPEWAKDRERLWNAAEQAERRKDACVAREFEVALPAELSPEDRRILVLNFARELANREGCGVDVAIHAPNKDGDQRNHHAHIMRTTRKIETDGLGHKLDTEKAGRNRLADLDAFRERWAVLVNEHLKARGIHEQVDHRSLELQGIQREATQHLGPAAVGYERRTGLSSEKRFQQEETNRERTQQRQVLDQQFDEQERSIGDLETSLEQAKRVQEVMRQPDVQQALESVRAEFTRRKIEHQRAQEKTHPHEREFEPKIPTQQRGRGDLER